MNAHKHEHRDGRLALGLLVGIVAGAGLTVWFAPYLSELRKRLHDSLGTVPVRVDDLAAGGEADDEHLRQDQSLRNDSAHVDAETDALTRATGDRTRDVAPATNEPVTSVPR